MKLFRMFLGELSKCIPIYKNLILKSMSFKAEIKSKASFKICMDFHSLKMSLDETRENVT